MRARCINISRDLNMYEIVCIADSDHKIQKNEEAELFCSILVVLNFHIKYSFRFLVRTSTKVVRTC